MGGTKDKREETKKHATKKQAVAKEAQEAGSATDEASSPETASDEKALCNDDGLLLNFSTRVTSGTHVREMSATEFFNSSYLWYVFYQFLILLVAVVLCFHAILLNLEHRHGSGSWKRSFMAVISRLI